MSVKEIEAKSILRKHKKIDSWFISRCGMNLYRGCTHNCVYCDGRSEGYYVEGEFGRDIQVKVNAIEVLRKELDPARKRRPFRPGFIMLGGGVTDAYQPVEKKYLLSRKTLQLICEHGYPVHILTKSTLVERDLDIIKKINEKSGAIVSFSFSSVEDDISAIFEPGVPPPSQRLKTLALFKRNGIACGMFLMPVIPFVTDSPEMMDKSIRRAAETGLDFIIFGGMTLKDGKQADYFYKTLNDFDPSLSLEYQIIYKGDKWGNATPEYNRSINETFYHLARKHRIPVRIPPVLYRNLLDENDLVVVTLEHIDHLMKLQGRRSPFGFAAYSISQLKEPLSEMRFKLRRIKGVNAVTERIILDVLDTGRSGYLERLWVG
jgi:DNA repair photolyase